jgi:hypothetical protein
MTPSQLATEYGAMPERYELYAKFGITAEAAQLFETDLGTLVLMLQAIENDWHNVPDGDAARKVLDSIERSTLGRLLKLLGTHLTLEGGLEDIFSSALIARNRLMHGWFERHNFKIQTSNGRADMIADLDNLHSELFKAWQLAGKLTTSFSAAMTELKASNPR